MRLSILTFAVVCIPPLAAVSQELTAHEKDVANAARAIYSDLRATGFQTLSCTVDFDRNSVPSFPLDTPVASLLKETRFSLTIDVAGHVTVQHQIPESRDQGAWGIAEYMSGKLISRLIQGDWQVWVNRGLSGPIPRSDEFIQSITDTDEGYVFFLRGPTMPSQLFTDKKFRPIKITSSNGLGEQYDHYVTGAHGLVLSSIESIGRADPSAPTRVTLDFTFSKVGDFELPTSIRMQQDPQPFDTTFSLSLCTVNGTRVQLPGDRLTTDSQPANPHPSSASATPDPSATVSSAKCPVATHRP